MTNWKLSLQFVPIQLNKPITTGELAQVMGDMNEAFSMVTHELKWSLPDKPYVALLWMADLISGEKKVVLLV